MRERNRLLYVALPVGMMLVRWGTDCMMSAFPIPTASILQGTVSSFGQKKQGISQRCMRNTVTSIGRRNPISLREGISLYRKYITIITMKGL